MKKLYLLLSILLPSVALAQANYHEGYVIKTNGDTLKGFINIQEWANSPRTIDFKANKGDKIKTIFSPGVIRKFQVTGMDTYIAYRGVVSLDRTEFPNLSDGLDTSKKVDTVFLRQLTTGKYLTLYYNNDDIKTRFFISESNATPVELKYYNYYKENTQNIEVYIYKEQLMALLNKYNISDEKLSNEVSYAKYDQNDLVKLIGEINGNRQAYQKAVDKRTVTRFFVGAAINSTKTEAGNFNYASQLKDVTSVTPKINVGFDILNNPYVQQVIFRVEASFTYITPKFYYPPTSYHGQEVYYTFNQYTLGVTPQILFNVYNKDRFKIYIDGGLRFNFSSYSNDKSTQVYYGGNIKTLVTEKPYDLETFWADFPFQAGVVLNKKIELHFTYTPYAAYTKYLNSYVSNQSINFGVKYLFGN